MRFSLTMEVNWHSFPLTSALGYMPWPYALVGYMHRLYVLHARTAFFVLMKRFGGVKCALMNHTRIGPVTRAFRKLVKQTLVSP